MAKFVAYGRNLSCLQHLLHLPDLCMHRVMWVHCAYMCACVGAEATSWASGQKTSGLANHDGQFWCRPLFKSRTCLELRWWVVVGLYDTAWNFSAQFQGEGGGGGEIHGKWAQAEYPLLWTVGQLDKFFQGRVSEQEREETNWSPHASLGQGGLAHSRCKKDWQGQTTGHILIEQIQSPGVGACRPWWQFFGDPGPSSSSQSVIPHCESQLSMEPGQP